MKRILVAGVMTGSSLLGLGAFLAPAAHADACVNYNLSINGQGQQGSECLSQLGLPALPGQ